MHDTGHSTPAARLGATLDRLERAVLLAAERTARARSLEAAAAAALAELDKALAHG